MARRSLVLVALLVSSLALVSAQRSTLSGTVAYRERIALPPTAALEVTLEDVSRADAASTIVARVRVDAPGQVPIPFDLPYASGDIDAAHRYAVRARIVDGERVIFTSTDATLVLTQGHPSRVSLLLRMVPGARITPPAPQAPKAQAAPAPAPKTPVEPAPRPLPVVELRNLPTTFSGTLPCADCPGIKYELNLFPDDSYFLRMTYLGRSVAPRDTIGSWVLSSDRRVVVLGGERETPDYWAIRDAITLRKLDVAGQPIASKQSWDLRRVGSVTPIDVRGTFKGSYVHMADAGRFTECSTGQSWPVAQQGANAELESAYQRARPRPGAAVLATVDGHVTRAQTGEEGRRDTALVVDRVAGVSAAEECAPRFAASPFENTEWTLVWLAGNDVAPQPNPRAVPGLTFRGDSTSFSGSSGCNRLAGQYDQRGELLSMRAAGTLMACPGAGDQERTFNQALANTRLYRVLGHTLELYDNQRRLLARFAAAREN
jgi:copper homeostasis protein (lipoprotein)